MSIIKITPYQQEDPYTGSGNPVPVSLTVQAKMEIKVPGDPAPEEPGGVNPTPGSNDVTESVQTDMQISLNAVDVGGAYKADVSTSMELVPNDVGLVSRINISLDPVVFNMTLKTYKVETDIKLDPIVTTTNVPGASFVDPVSIDASASMNVIANDLDVDARGDLQELSMFNEIGFELSEITITSN